MPLVAHSGLPTFERLRASGQEVLSLERARHQDIRELHIGFLNMMPDAAIQATERQFMRLVGGCNRIAQIFVHPFSVAVGARGRGAREYIDRYYEDFETLKQSGLDAMVITGANPAQPDITKEPFWAPLLEVMDWAGANVCSVVCSCLATHAFVHHYLGLERRRCEPGKRWGVYSHRTLGRHPLLADINTRFDAPHSHVYEVTREQLEGAGVHILAHGAEGGVHLAVSADGARFVFFQGHPEYDINSLLKEYKREVSRFASGVREEYPPYPEHYFPPRCWPTLDAYRRRVMDARTRGVEPAEFPEDDLTPELDNTWADSGKAIYNNWLGLVYQLTQSDTPTLGPNDLLSQRTA